MSRAQHVRHADDLSEDDHEAVREITGALYDGAPVDRRMRRAPPVRRNCPPSVLRNREYWFDFYLACQRHEEGFRMSEKANKEALAAAEKMV